MIKNILTLLALCQLSNINATTYILKTSSNFQDSVVIELSVNEQGFYNNGIHKDTDTLYNPEGFDKEGFDLNGLGVLSCTYDTSNYIKTDGRYPTRYYFNGVSTISETADYLFTRGEYDHGMAYWNQRWYEICSQSKK